MVDDKIVKSKIDMMRSDVESFKKAAKNCNMRDMWTFALNIGNDDNSLAEHDTRFIDGEEVAKIRQSLRNEYYQIADDASTGKCSVLNSSKDSKKGTHSKRK